MNIIFSKSSFITLVVLSMIYQQSRASDAACLKVILPICQQMAVRAGYNSASAHLVFTAKDEYEQEEYPNGHKYECYAGLVNADEYAFFICEERSDVPTTLIPVSSSSSPNVCSHSGVNIDTLSLQESIPVVGVPFYLSYSSERFRAGSALSQKSLGFGGWTPSLVHHYDSTNKIIYYGTGGKRVIEAVAMDGGFYSTDESGSEIYEFNQQGVHLKTKDGVLGLVKYNFVYDESGRLSSISDRFNNQTNFSYLNGQTIITSSYGQKTKISFDGNGFLASVINPNNETYVVTNSASGNLETFTKPQGQKSYVTYDSNGYVTKDLGAGGDFISLVQSFNANTGVQTVTSSTALNRTTTYVTKAASGSSNHEITGADGGLQKTSNEDKGTNSSTDVYGNTMQVVQGADPRFGWSAPYSQSSTFVVPNSNINVSTSVVKSAELADSNNPLSVVSLTTKTTLQNDSQRVFTSTYQAANQLLTTKSPLNRVVYEVLNSQGQVASVKVGSLLPVTFSYDSLGRLTSMNQSQRKTVLNYDSHGNLLSKIDPLGHKTSFEYNEANRLTKQILPDGHKILMSYDANGNIISITPSGRPAHAFEYNLFELIDQYAPPALGLQSVSTKYNYNLDKQVTDITRPDGSQISFSYNASSGYLNNISTVQGDYSVIYKDKTDLISQMTSPDQQVLDYQYAGNIPLQIQESGVVNSLLKYTYNMDGSISTIDINGSVQNINYDKDGLVTQVGSEVLTRNLEGAVSQTAIGSLKENINYDQFGQMISNDVNFNKKNLYLAKYQRDKLGRITSVQSKEGSREFAYDLQGRLSKVKEGHHQKEYKYDSNGNRIEVSGHGHKIKAIYDDQDRLLKYGKHTYEYNANGERIAKIDNDDDDHNWFQKLCDGFKKDDEKKKIKYTYDSFGNLKSVTFPNKKKIEYILDGQNRRVGKKINGKLVQGYVYQNQTQIIAELDGNNNLVSRFIYGTKTNVPDMMIRNNKEYKIISDQVGTPQLVVEVKTGKVVEELEFDEFGNSEEHEGHRMIPFGFAGGLYDVDTKLTLFGARSYDAEVGRWLSKDPIGFAAGDTNLYGYTFNDPVNFIDPSGFRTFVGGTGSQAALAGAIVGGVLGSVFPGVGTTIGIIGGGAIGGILGGTIGNVANLVGGRIKVGVDTVSGGIIGGAIGGTIGSLGGATAGGIAVGAGAGVVYCSEKSPADLANQFDDILKGF